MAGRSHAIFRTIDAPTSSILGVLIPDIRVADPRGDGRGLDSYS